MAMFDDFREWLSDNLRYILLGLCVVLLAVVIFCVVRLISGGGNKQTEGSSNTASNITVTSDNDAVEAVTENGEEEEPSSEASAATTPSVSTGDLVKNDAALLTLVQQYYTGVAEKNIGTLSQIVDPWDETVSQNILSSDVIEAYQNISTYSKKGLNEGEYVVFAYYEAQVPDVETLVPGLAMLYIKTGDGGKLVIDSAHDSDAEVTALMTQVSNDSDVQALISDVNRRYEEALASDEALSSYIASLEPEASSGEENVDTSSSTAEGSTASTSDTQVGSTMAATTTINIRQTASTDAAIMGVLPEGTEITVTSGEENGWIQIDYVTSNGTISGYVKLEYLTSVSGAVSDTASDTTADDSVSDSDTIVVVDTSDDSTAA